jgi:hypothetical protein
MASQRWLWIIFFFGTLHASLYALLVPPWQAPDEPGHMEYGCLMARLGRPPDAASRSTVLQAEIIHSLANHAFWQRVGQPTPNPLPPSFAAAPFLARSGTQIGDEPFLFYVPVALICSTSKTMATKLRLARLVSALLFGLTGLAVVWGYSPQSKNPNQDRKTSDCSSFCMLHSLVVVLLPMPAFIAGSANNDALAVATATAVFAAVLRIQRLGWTWLRSLILVLFLVVALLSKKTNTFLLPWLAILTLTAAWHPLRRRLPGWRLPLTLTASTALVILILLMPSAAPAAWRGRGQPLGRGRVRVATRLEQGDPWTAEVVDQSPHSYGRLFQSITGQKAQALRGEMVEATALVRSGDDHFQPGRLTIRDAAAYSQVTFVAGHTWTAVTISHTVAPTTTYVKLAVAPGYGRSATEKGRLLIGDLRLTSADADNLLRNGSFDEAAPWGEILVIAPVEPRWQQFGPRFLNPEAYSRSALGRYALYTGLTFAGFWGNFGWLQRPLPVWIYGLLALVCLLAALGLIRCLIRTGQAQARQEAEGLDGKKPIPDLPRLSVLSWLLAVTVIALQTLIPMVGRDWQPQGRYLFPALLPWTGLLLVGLNTWLRLEEHPRRSAALILILLALAATGLVWASRT